MVGSGETGLHVHASLAAMGVPRTAECGSTDEWSSELLVDRVSAPRILKEPGHPGGGTGRSRNGPLQWKVR